MNMTHTLTLSRQFYLSCLVFLLLACGCESSLSSAMDEQNALAYSLHLRRRTSADTPRLRVTAFIDDDDELHSCASNLIVADQDDDNRLSKQEYGEFLAMRSDDKVTSDFSQMKTVFVMIYYTVACSKCYQETRDEECCVGRSTYIPLMKDNSTDEAVLLSFVCAQVDNAIMDLFPVVPTYSPTKRPMTPVSPSSFPSLHPSEAPSSIQSAFPSISQSLFPSISPSTTLSSISPSSSPSAIPSVQISRAPSLGPSILASSLPSAEPSSSPSLPSAAPSSEPSELEKVPTAAPSHQPSFMPTDAPKSEPSSIPSMSPSQIPSLTSTNAPTSKPSPVPSVFPSQIPSFRATDDPTSEPSPVPSMPPSPIPSISPSVRPSYTPSVVSSSAPSPFPSSAPSVKVRTACITFSYTLENQANLTASDIMDETNNRVKTGLLIATRNITMQIVSGGGGGRLRRRFLQQEDGTVRAIQLGLRHELSGRATNLDINNDKEDDQLDAFSKRLLSMYFPGSGPTRRLAFYSDEYPAEIVQILDNPYCPRRQEDGITLCAIVETRACVVLEAGDDEAQVRELLVSGFRSAINSGEFWESFPPEYMV